MTGQLLGHAGGALYAVDLASGQPADLGATLLEDVVSTAVAVAFDFNIQIDAVGADGSKLV